MFGPYRGPSSTFSMKPYMYVIGIWVESSKNDSYLYSSWILLEKALIRLRRYRGGGGAVVFQMHQIEVKCKKKEQELI